MAPVYCDASSSSTLLQIRQPGKGRFTALKMLLALLITTLTALPLTSEQAPLSLPSSSSDLGSDGSNYPKPLVLDDKLRNFKLTVHSDLHYGEAEDMLWGPAQDVNSTRVTRAVLAFESPNLVVFNGDLITGENTFAHNSTFYLDKVVRPALDLGTPWASTYGNHDNDVNISHAWLLARERSEFAKSSFTASFVPDEDGGIGAYFVPVFWKSSAPISQYDEIPNARPALLLWFFDSRSGKDSQGDGYPDWVSTSTVKWYESTMKAMETQWGSLPKSLAFVHVPTRQSWEYQQDLINPSNGHDSSKQNPDSPDLANPGLNDDEPLAYQASEGYQGPEGYTGEDQDFINALKSTQGLIALVSGHDHGDAWCASQGLTVCFGRHSGYGGYGTWARGARVFQVQNGSISTWNRMEDGQIIDHVALGSLYP